MSTNQKNSYFKNLIDTERGANQTSLVGSYDKQLKQLKKNVEKAIQKYLKSKPNDTERMELNSMLAELPKLSTTSSIC